VGNIKSLKYMLDILTSRLLTLKELEFYPKTILDIGAYHGDWSTLVHGIWPDSKIFMVEANADQRPTLAKITWTEGFEIALLGDKKRRQVGYYATTLPVTTGNSIFREQTHYFDNCEIRNLPMTTLDSVVKKRNLKNINLIKIDVQGSELNVIKGGKNTVANAQFILLETQNLEYNLGAPDTAQVLIAMQDLGFQLYDITEIHHLPTGEMFEIDLLFVKQNSPFIKRGTLV